MGPSKTLSWMDNLFIAVVIMNTLKKAALPVVAQENWILFCCKKMLCKYSAILFHYMPLQKNSDLFIHWKFMYIHYIFWQSINTALACFLSKAQAQAKNLSKGLLLHLSSMDGP